MNKLFLIVILAWNSLASAQSQDTSFTEIVSTSSVKILGKGLLNKDTKEVLAYACVGITAENAEPSCDQIRMIYYSPQDQKSYFFGNKIEISSESPKKIHRMFKRIRKAYYQQNPTKLTQAFKQMGHWMKDVDHASGVGVVGGIGVVGLEYALIPAGHVTAIAGASILAAPILIPAAVIGSLYLVSIIKFNPITSSTFQSFYNTNEWNWSVEPHSVSSEKFEKVFSFLKIVQL